MALVDAAFRAGLSDDVVSEFVTSVRLVDVRISPPSQSVVTHTFVKVRQESRSKEENEPYTSSIAYRELVHHFGRHLWAFDLSSGNATLAEQLVMVSPHVSYIGKRGSFIQFRSIERLPELGPHFSQSIKSDAPLSVPERAHIVPLDDFGPEADLETLSSFSDKQAKRDKHRRFVRTIIPVGVINTGPGFTQYG